MRAHAAAALAAQLGGRYKCSPADTLLEEWRCIAHTGSGVVLLDKSTALVLVLARCSALAAAGQLLAHMTCGRCSDLRHLQRCTMAVVLRPVWAHATVEPASNRPFRGRLRPWRGEKVRVARNTRKRGLDHRFRAAPAKCGRNLPAPAVRSCLLITRQSSTSSSPTQRKYLSVSRR